MEDTDEPVLESLAWWLLSKRVQANISTLPSDLWQELFTPAAALLWSVACVSLSHFLHL